MQEIKFTVPFKLGDRDVTDIRVQPASFMEMCDIWGNLRSTGDKARAELQRGRILLQTHFLSGKDRLIPDVAQLSTMPAPIAREVVAALDIGSGPMGKVLAKGDGVSTPVLYQLGTPIEFISADKTIKVNELEFMASTYGELEDVMATANDADKAKMLLMNVAAPVGAPTPRLPGWALDRITIGDGVSIMNNVCPLF